MQKVVDWQGWIFAAYPKGEASERKSYAVWDYHSNNPFEFLTAIRHAMKTYSLNSYNVCMKIIWENTLQSFTGEMLSFSMIMQVHIVQKSRSNKYWILASLFYPVHYIH